MLRERAISGALSVLPSRAMALVARLFRDRGPAHIARLVMAVVIDPVDRMLQRWAAAHVGEKSGVGRAPFVADPDAPAAVLGESWILRVVTPLLHASPGDVFRRKAVMLCVPVDDVIRLLADLRDFASQTATTANDLTRIYQVMRRQYAFGAAITEASPHHGTLAVRRTVHDQQPAEALAAELANFHAANHISWGTR